MRTVGYIATAFVGADATYLEMTKMDDSESWKIKIGSVVWYRWCPDGFMTLTDPHEIAAAVALKKEVRDTNAT